MTKTLQGFVVSLKFTVSAHCNDEGPAGLEGIFGLPEISSLRGLPIGNL